MIAARDNMTVVASTWEDAEVAPADLVICCHVLYGVADPVPFIAKLEKSAHERVFVMLRETDLPHPARIIRTRLAGQQVRDCRASANCSCCCFRWASLPTSRS